MNTSDITPLTLAEVVLNALSIERFSRYPDGKCAYRGEGGAQCAIGASIPDDLYMPGMDSHDGSSVYEWVSGLNQRMCPEETAVMQALFGGIPLECLTLLQRAHDQADCLSEYREKVLALAEKWEIEVPASFLINKGAL